MGQGELQMKLHLLRQYFTQNSIIGNLYIDGKHECLTMELPWLDNLPQKSCIPEGTYPVGMWDSPHFRREVPILCNVPGRSSIEIHIANEPKELRGCIAVGSYRGNDFIGHSRDAFETLFTRLQTALAGGEIITITIDRERVST
jgi:hypothetical protein